MVANRTQTADEIVLGRDDWRRQVARDYEASAQRLTEAYERILPRLQQEAGEFSVQLRLLTDDGQGRLTAQEMRNLSSYQRLLLRVETELDDFSAILRNEASGIQQRAITMGTNAAIDLSARQVGPLANALRTAWNRPDPAALERLINYVDGDALRGKFAAFGENAAQNLSDVLIAFVAQGKNPAAIGDMISTWFAVPPHWADTMARTVQLWSYRTATHASYRANPNVVTGWVWSSALDVRTCISCINQHGKIFPVTDILTDHHRGRCAALPIVRGTTWTDTYETGQDWFERQSQATQIQIMGYGMHNAWQRGAVNWNDLSRPYNDSVYGEMLAAPSLKELLGAGAQRYYYRGSQ